MEEIDVPPFFICPISLQIMKDPVTVSTGITYDRESIEKWLFSGKNNACPVTKQSLSSDSDLTPNHTVRRLIQSWCTINASHGIERIPTPKPQINRFQISKLISDAKTTNLQLKCLTTLRSLSSDSESNKRTIESAGGVEFLASIVKNNAISAESEESSNEALSILYNLHITDSGLKNLVSGNNDFIQSLKRVLQSGNDESRAYAILILKSMLEVADPMQLIGLKTEYFFEIVRVLRDQISEKASKATLKILIQICPWGRNRVKAVESGAVSVLINLLLEVSGRRITEMILIVLDLLCGCAEGRSELLKHGGGLAIVSKKILRVSQMASERGVRILLMIAKFSATPWLIQEMMQLGIVNKLCLVIEVDGSRKTKEKAREILKLHARSWKNSPCFPINFLASYPS